MYMYNCIKLQKNKQTSKRCCEAVSNTAGKVDIFLSSDCRYQSLSISPSLWICENTIVFFFWYLGKREHKKIHL